MANCRAPVYPPKNAVKPPPPPPPPPRQSSISKILVGRTFLQHLHAAGIIPGETQRVVIDANCREAVTLYVQQLGTDFLLKVITPESLRGTVIVTTEELARMV